ncbi:hypothetical protein RRG08_049110 [Elysia crispata]|uniref:Uncharacterized protein n=1 Tax=Elysia crispata TaxID=231223 RepID=A0AAE0YX45_9GAST|nr:hypothetical protein RRG08_049110 [Elysia crispata]
MDWSGKRLECLSQTKYYDLISQKFRISQLSLAILVRPHRRVSGPARESLRELKPRLCTPSVSFSLEK